MKLKLPVIGEVKTGRDAIIDNIVKDTIVMDVGKTAKKEKFFDVLGGFLEFNTGKLTSDKTISSKILLANKGWVYRNNDAIAQEVSKVNFKLYTAGLNGGEIVYNEVNSHPLLDLLDRPNMETTKNDSIYIIQSHKKLTGNAFWVKIRNGKQVVALRALPPDKVSLKLQNPTETDPTVILSYEYKDVIDGNKVEVSYDPKDIIHFKKPNPNNQFLGIGAIEALADTIDLDNLTTETTKRFFQNGSITNFVLSTDSKLTDDQLKRLRAEMRASSGGVSNAFKAMILGGGLKPENISYSNKELEFLKQLEWYRDKIMVGFGNTKASLGIVEDVNRANAEATLGGWLRSTVKPDMEAIVNTLNEFLVPEFGTNLILGFDDPVPEDRTNDIVEAERLFKAGVIMRSEAREIMGLESDKGDDVYYESVLGVLSPDSLEPNNE